MCTRCKHTHYGMVQISQYFTSYTTTTSSSLSSLMFQSTNVKFSSSSIYTAKIGLFSDSIHTVHTPSEVAVWMPPDPL